MKLELLDAAAELKSETNRGKGLLGQSRNEEM